MSEREKKYVVEGGQVCTAHVNRNGKLVDFRPCSIWVYENKENKGLIQARITPSKGVKIKPLLLSCVYRDQLTPISNFATGTGIVVRMRSATKICFILDKQVVRVHQRLDLGLDPDDVKKLEQFRTQEEARKETEKARNTAMLVKQLSPQIAELMKTPINRKQLLRWARTDWLEDAAKQRMFGHSVLPNELKEVILRIEEEDRAVRKKAWLATHPQT